MDHPPKVASLTEFMSWVASTRPTIESEHVLFYRGHADWEYKLEPSVYRTNNKGESFRFVEHNLYEEMLRREPIAFSGDKTVFERLVRMQHHGLPTRLLDLTHSPLIALYFSCCDDDGKDGEVIFFPRKRAQVDYPSDAPEAALVGVEQTVDFSHIAKQTAEFFRDYFSRVNPMITKRDDLHEEFCSLLNNSVATLDAVAKNSTDLLVVVSALHEIETRVIPEFIQKWRAFFSSEASKEGESAQNIILAHESEIAILKFERDFDVVRENYIGVRCDKLRMRHNEHKKYIHMFLAQFTHFFFVYAPINNERIRRQQGAFVIFPPGKTEHWHIEHMQPEIHRIRIDGNSKMAIMQELAHLGITKSYIFPELTILAEDVKLRYPALVNIPATFNQS